MKSFSIVITLFLLSATPLFAQITDVISQDKLQELESIATQDVPPNAPGIATAIIKDGNVIFKKYSGFADLEDSVEIGENTRFNLASNGKQFTALAILTLIESGKLDLSDDLRKFFPDLFPKIKEEITIRHLLNHTSGIRDCYDLWALQGITWWRKTYDNQDVLALLQKQQDLNFSPGSKYLYSNSNYILLALIIENLSGQSFVAYTNQIFQDLNMPNTSFEPDHTSIRGPIAYAYFNFDTWTGYNWMWNAVGDGNLFSTLEDQIQWEKVVQGKAITRINPEIIKKSQKVIPDSEFKNYGYGLEFGKYKGLDYSFHEGATGAWKATVLRFAEQNISMITLTNTGKSIPSMQTRQMADVIFSLEEAQKYLVTKPESVGEMVSEAEIEGTYLTENDFTFQFEMRDGSLFLIRNGRNDVELEREAANIFHQKYDPDFKQEFTYAKDGELEVTAYYINHAPYSLTKLNADFRGFEFKSLEGLYLNTETNTKLSIEYLKDQNFQVSLADGDPRNGLLISPSKLLIGNYGVEIRKIESKIPALYLNGDRIKNVKFVRVD